MASNSRRKSGSSARSTGRKRVVIGAEETVRSGTRRTSPKSSPSAAAHRARGSEQLRAPARVRVRGWPTPSATSASDASVRLSRRRLLVLAGVALAVSRRRLGARLAVARADLLGRRRPPSPGTQRLTTAQVLARAQVPDGRDAPAARRSATSSIGCSRIHGSPRRGSTARFPHTLGIEIVERKPVAIDRRRRHARSGSSTAPASGSRSARPRTPGRCRWSAMSRTSPRRPASRSTSPELLNALAVLGGLSPELRAKVRTVSAPTVDRTALILPHGVQVFFGSAEDVAKKDTVARAILAENKNVVYVNVRVVNRPTWRGLDSGN